jgi:hypothetical protein
MYYTSYIYWHLVHNTKITIHYCSLEINTSEILPTRQISTSSRYVLVSFRLLSSVVLLSLSYVNININLPQESKLKDQDLRRALIAFSTHLSIFPASYSAWFTRGGSQFVPGLDRRRRITLVLTVIGCEVCKASPTDSKTATNPNHNIILDSELSFKNLAWTSGIPDNSGSSWTQINKVSLVELADIKSTILLTTSIHFFFRYQRILRSSWRDRSLDQRRSVVSLRRRRIATVNPLVLLYTLLR